MELLTSAIGRFGSAQLDYEFLFSHGFYSVSLDVFFTLPNTFVSESYLSSGFFSEILASLSIFTPKELLVYYHSGRWPPIF